MTTFHFVLLITALLIIAALAGYAWHLLQQVKKVNLAKEKEQAEAELQLRHYQEELVSDIRFVSRSVVQQQCDITEGVLRIQHMITGLDPNAWQLTEITAIREHYDATKHMPILDAYKALKPKQRFELDKQRLQLENDNKLSIEKEFRWLAEYSFPQVSLLQ
ncbi:MAG: DUF2489 domain-containing protein [Alcanivorax sp.]|jgi:hypothetical protein|nr:MAG: hypothetical protein COA68_14780 [Oceanobacter sp.]|tara:strand:- start:32170 stop:32655 length:486 start_codon:yes stop_codon:yes gene_type:complete